MVNFVLYVFDLSVVVNKFMDLTHDGIPVKQPKKRAPVKRQATVLWESCEKPPLEQKLQELEAVNRAAALLRARTTSTTGSYGPPANRGFYGQYSPEDEQN